MANKNDYKMKNYNDILSGDFNGQDSNGVDYYDALMSENYKVLLNAEVQASNAKENALKYMQNTARANGLYGSGKTDSMQAGLINNYYNALGQARSDFQSSQNESIGELEARSADRLANAEGYIETAGNVDTANQTLKQLGYMDEKGNFGGEFNNLSKYDQNQLLTYYNQLFGSNGGEVVASSDNEKTFTNTKTGITTDFSAHKEKVNKNFYIGANGVKNEFELGNLKGDNKNLDYSNKSNGDVWVEESRAGYISFLTKTSDGNVFEVQAVGKKSNENNAQQFMNVLTQLGYNVQKTTGANKQGIYFMVNNQKYHYVQDPNGRVFLERA